MHFTLTRAHLQPKAWENRALQILLEQIGTFYRSQQFLSVTIYLIHSVQGKVVLQEYTFTKILEFNFNQLLDMTIRPIPTIMFFYFYK